MVKISIVIPVHNIEKYLSQCLESIKNQTLSDFEVICINDGSTDSSLKILKDFASKDSRFKIIDKKNEGQGVARNLGISKSEGEYILCMDSDDWLETDGLKKAYNKIKNDNADILIFDYYKFFEKTQTKSVYKNTSVYSQLIKPFTPKDAGKTLLLNNSLPFKMYRGEFLKKNNVIYSNHKFMEDAPFYIKAMLLAKKITCLEEPISNYRIHSASMTFDYKKYLTSMPEVYDICFNLIKDFEQEIDILESFLINRKRALFYFYKLTPFTKKPKYYKMIQEIAKNYFLEYNCDARFEEICKKSFFEYEILGKLRKTLTILKTYME